MPLINHSCLLWLGTFNSPGFSLGDFYKGLIPFVTCDFSFHTITTQGPIWHLPIVPNKFYVPLL